MFVDFFIRRPVFSGVVAIIIALLGAISIPGLPISEYPTLAPPQVTVTAIYTGASAEVVEATVTTPLEEAINGSPGMKYMSSSTSNAGVCTITVTYDLGMDQDLAAVDVQNRIQTVMGMLPAEVKQTGVIVTKTSQALIMATGVYAEHGEYDNLFLSNYVDVYMAQALQRVPGVAEVRIFGERKYAMRIWLDPARLAARSLTATDVLTALGDQNVEIAAGSLGAPPSLPGQTFEFSVRVIGRLTTPEEFGDIVLKRGPIHADNPVGDAIVRLRDVGRVELGAEDYTSNLRFNGHLAVGIGIFQLPDANALDVDRGVRDALQELSKRFPPGMKYVISLDTTTVIGDSIRDVLYTLAAAIALVIAVIFFFLQSVRSTVIPAITIPVSLIGTFIFVHLFGFSINTLTLFGLTLATGLVVDDAIVVIENIERHIHLGHQSPRAASSTAMGEVVGAVIATSLVLIAVFVPVALISGTTGILYKQFSLTLAFSIALSAFNALTLTPSLSALLLRKTEKHGRFFSWVNRWIDRFTEGYKRGLAHIFRHAWIVLLGFVAALAATWWLWGKVPHGFVPTEDQGYFLVTVQAPDGASLDYTTDVVKQVEQALRAESDVSNIFSVIGFSFTGSGSNKAMLFPSLKEGRHGREHSAAAVVARLRRSFGGITGAIVVPFEPPAIRGVGSFGGFQLEVEQRGTGTLGELAQGARQMMVVGNQEPSLRGVFTAFTADAPQLVLTIDRDKAKSLDVPITEVRNALQVYMASVYVNDYTLGERSYRVYAQAEPRYRTQPKSLEQLYVRSQQGQLLPLAGLVKLTPTTTAPLINHYNLFRSAELNGAAAPGYSSGDAITTMERMAEKILPRGTTYEWSGLALEELEAGHKTPIIFALGILFVFLVLAAQYESFLLPFIILLAVPLAILGALAAVWLRGIANDVFTQVGLVMLIGLASKNAILIVEFAEQLRAQGRSVVDAAIESSGIRLRPILMTSFAFILGVLPLVFATGAGEQSRHSLGTAVFGGMIVSTVLNLLLIPVLYVVIQGWRERHGAKVRE